MLAQQKGEGPPRKRCSRRRGRVHRPQYQTLSSRRRILVPGPAPPIGTYSRRIVAPRPPPMSTTAKLASDVFCGCAITAPCRICPSPQPHAFEDEIAIKPRPRAVAIVLSSSEADATFECLNDLKSLSSKEDLKFLQKFDKLYILLCVDKELMAMVDNITEETTRGRVMRDLSNNKSATLKIKDLDKLDGFLGWSWKDIQKRLQRIKKKLKFILYVKKNGQLVEAIKVLHLDHVYLVTQNVILLKTDAQC